MENTAFRVYVNPIALKQSRYEVQTPTSQRQTFLYQTNNNNNHSYSTISNIYSSNEAHINDAFPLNNTHHHIPQFQLNNNNSINNNLENKTKMTPRSKIKKTNEASSNKTPRKASGSTADQAPATGSEKKNAMKRPTGVPPLKRIPGKTEQQQQQQQTSTSTNVNISSTTATDIKRTPRRNLSNNLSQNSLNQGNISKSKNNANTGNPLSQRDKKTKSSISHSYSEDSRSKMSPLYRSPSKSSLNNENKTASNLNQVKMTPRSMAVSVQRTPRTPEIEAMSQDSSSDPKEEINVSEMIKLEQRQNDTTRSQSDDNGSVASASRITLSSSTTHSGTRQHCKTLSAEIEELDLIYDKHRKTPSPRTKVQKPLESSSSVTTSDEHLELNSMSHMEEDYPSPSFDLPYEDFFCEVKEEEYKEDWKAKTRRFMPKILEFLGEVTIISLEIFIGIILFNETSKIRNRMRRTKENESRRRREALYSILEEEEEDGRAVYNDAVWNNKKLNLSYFSDGSLSETYDY